MNTDRLGVKSLSNLYVKRVLIT